MLKRKMYQDLLDYKENRGKECLLIKGARQTGKTYLVEHFGKREYASFIEMNFLRDSSLKEIFEGDLNADLVLKRITTYIPGVRLIPGETLIFLDEIQKCARARTALKFLAEDMRVDVIASGSLLGLHYGQDADKDVEEVESIPVGYERPLEMHSMDFEEFLWANGYDHELLDTLKNCFDAKVQVPPALNEKCLELFREFLVVGGMPEVVASFAAEKDFTKVQAIQEKILSDYDDDIANHAGKVERLKVRACYRTVPSQLARENKKFKYSAVEKKATSRKYWDSIAWLQDANFIRLCLNVQEPYLPLVANEKENEFKVYVNDTGLLLARYGAETKRALLTKQLKGNAKGGIYENAIAEALLKKGYSLHYYKREDSTQELEFLIEKDGTVIPVEVKAGNTNTPSMNRYIDENQPPYAYKLVDGNVGVVERKITLPHYMSIFL